MLRFKVSNALAISVTLGLIYTMLHYGILISLVLFLVPVVFLWGTEFFKIGDLDYNQKWILVGGYTFIRLLILSIFYVVIVKEVLFVDIHFNVHASYLAGMETSEIQLKYLLGNELDLGFLLRMIAFLPVVIIEGMALILPPFYIEKYISITNGVFTTISVIVAHIIFSFVALNILTSIFNILLPMVFG